MRSSIIIAAVIAFAAAAWIASGLIVPHEEAAQESAAESAREAREAPPPRVRVRDTTARETVTPLVVHGTTTAARSVEVRAEVSGRVVEVLADEGARVEAGDVLVRLDMGNRRERLEQARALVDQRELQFSAAESLAQRDFGSRTRLAEARAELGKARAELAAIEQEIDHTAVRAPFAGVLEHRAAEVGDLPGPGGLVGTVIDLDPLRVDVAVAERLIGRLAVGAPADVRLIDGRTARGTVSRVSARANPATRTFTAEISVPNAEADIPEGMTAEVRIGLEAISAHLVSPAILTLDGAGRVGVMLVDADDRATFAPVSIVRDGPDGIWLAGLPASVRLITVGKDYVVPGQRVTPVPENAEATGSATAEAAEAPDGPDASDTSRFGAAAEAGMTR